MKWMNGTRMHIRWTFLAALLAARALCKTESESSASSDGKESSSHGDCTLRSGRIKGSSQSWRDGGRKGETEGDVGLPAGEANGEREAEPGVNVAGRYDGTVTSKWKTSMALRHTAMQGKAARPKQAETSQKFDLHIKRSLPSRKSWRGSQVEASTWGKEGESDSEGGRKDDEDDEDDVGSRLRLVLFGGS